MGGVEGQFPEMGYNPLLNNVILSTVLEHVSRNDLRVCRLVCRTWSEVAIPVIRSKLKVFLHGIQSWGYGTRNREMSYFVKIFSTNTLGIPLSRFQLERLPPDWIFDQFVQLCGETTTEIDLSGQSQPFVIEDISKLLRSFPKLEVFVPPRKISSRSGQIVKLFPENLKLKSLKKLIISKDDCEGRKKYCPTFFQELIAAAENIVKFDIIDPYGDGEEVSSGVEVLNSIENSMRESNITIEYLNLINTKNMDVHLVQLQRMSRKGLKIKRLNISSATFGVLLELTTLFKHTLEIIRLNQSVDFSFTQFPKIPNLRKLNLLFLNDFNCNSVSLKNIFPVLDTLELGFKKEYLFQDGAEFFPDSDPSLSVKSLNLRYVHMTKNTLDRILNVFPRLTELKFNIEENGAEILKSVGILMTELESLSIVGTMPNMTDTLDSLLTGIPTQMIKEIQQEIMDLETMDPNLRRETILKLRSRHSKIPSIANLTNLRRLELGVAIEGDFGKGRKRNFLTDVSGYLAFYFMEHLQYLNLYLSELSRTCCQLLTVDKGINVQSIH